MRHTKQGFVRTLTQTLEERENGRMCQLGHLNTDWIVYQEITMFSKGTMLLYVLKIPYL